MLLLYLGSTLYHAWPRTRDEIHFAGAGSFRDFLVDRRNIHAVRARTLRGAEARRFLESSGRALIFGVVMKATRGPSRHPKLAMSLYLGMGWLIPIANHPLALAIPLSAWNLALAGGIAYTVGILFFANERLRYAHFIWHLFVLAGTVCHFVAVFSCAS